MRDPRRQIGRQDRDCDSDGDRIQRLFVARTAIPPMVPFHAEERS